MDTIIILFGILFGIIVMLLLIDVLILVCYFALLKRTLDISNDLSAVRLTLNTILRKL